MIVDMSVHAAHPSLKPFVKGYFLMHFRMESCLNTIFAASPDTGLLFYYGREKSAVHYDFINKPQKKYAFDTQQLWLCGLHDEPIKAQMSQNVDGLFVMCTPLGIQQLLHDNVKTAVNDGFSFETMGLQKKFDGLAEQLYDIPNGLDAIKKAEAYLMRYYNPIKVPFSVKDMSPVVDYIFRQKGMVQVQRLEEKFRISRRWLEKQFSEQIGFSPKEYARIVRFKFILAQLAKTPSVCWGTLIEDFGYYDQSHLIRDFHSYTGLSPTEYVKMAPNGVNEL